MLGNAYHFHPSKTWAANCPVSFRLDLLFIAMIKHCQQVPFLCFAYINQWFYYLENYYNLEHFDFLILNSDHSN